MTNETDSEARKISNLAAQQALSRWEAQKQLGLVGRVDWLLGALVLGGFLATLVCSFWPSVPVLFTLLLLVLSLFFAGVWAVILLYRALIFILDLHADVALMPESAARIVAGYYEGKNPQAKA